MGIDWSKLGKKRDEAKAAAGGGSLWKIEVGETRGFIHGQCYPDDDFELTRGLNFIEVWVHYSGGKNKRGGHVCLDPIANPIILHPIVTSFLSKRKKNAFTVSERTRCPTCEGIRAGTIAAEEAPQKKWLLGVTPMFYRPDSESPWIAKKFEPKVHMGGNQVFNGVSDSMVELSKYRDITNPNDATLLRFTREGSSWGDTNYDVKPDLETTMTPIKLDKGQRRVLNEAMKEGGSCDLFKVIANFMKSPEQIRAGKTGVETDEDVGGGDGVDRKECYGVDWADDNECAECPDSDDCRNCCQACETDGDSEEGEEAEDNGAYEDNDTGYTEEPLPECFGSWERANSDCLACDVTTQCQNETPSAEPPPKPPSIPKRPPPASPKSAAAIRGKTPGRSMPNKAEEDEADDPDLAAIEAEAANIRGKRKAPPARR